MNSRSMIKWIVRCFLLLVLTSQSANAQMEKSWPVWGLDNGWEFVAEAYTNTLTTSYVENTYSGGNFSMGFYAQNGALNGTTGLRYGIKYIATSSALFVYYNSNIVASINVTLNSGDVMQVKYSNGRFIMTRNGLESNFVNYGNNFSYLYPYFKDDSGSGKEEAMSLHVESIANVSPSWIAYSSYRIAPNYIGRGEDGAIEMEYNGANSYMQARFMTAKNHDYYGYCIARFYIHPSNRILRMYYRNPNATYEHKQTNSWSSTSITLSTSEFFVGTKIRMAREGSTIVYYVNGEEKKRINTDANFDLHPIGIRYFSGQENYMKLTPSKEGGVCDNYFNSKASYISAATASNYYETPAVNENWNTVTTRSYDGEGESVCNMLVETRSYFDEMGREVQTQSKDVATETVWATATLYDSYGREAITTLAAPTGSEGIQYVPSFVRDNTGQAYDTNDFEGAKLNNPSAVGEQVNTLGWWYSTNNTDDPWQATSDFPYSRVEYSAFTGAVRRMTSPGDVHRMGSGRETATYSMPAGNELRYVFGDKHPMCLLAGDSFYDSGNNIQNQCNSSSNFDLKYLKTVSVDANGKETVTFTDRDGKQVAKAMSGSTSSTSTNLKSTTILVKKGNFHDIHITKRSVYSTTLTFSGSNKNYTIYNLKTDQLASAASSSSSKSLAAGFYRIQNNNSSQNLTVTYSLNYYDFALSISNHKGQMIASVAPKDVDYDQVNPDHAAFSYYKYNSLGLLVWDRTPDGGRSDFYYSKEGKLRFSKDSKQYSYSRFSYMKYDRSNRIIELGECNSLPSGDLSSGLYVDNINYPTSGLSNRTYYSYDVADSAFPIAGYSQTYVPGKLSKTWNDQETIWYSYDEMGRAKWIARKINGAPSAKITEYTYDFVGNVTTVVFQKNQSDEFRHQYSYDRRSKLKSSATRRDDHVNSAPINQGQYDYNLDGNLKSKVLAAGLEQQTFAHTLSGKLKAINPEDMRETDIGQGGRHPFSLALHYYLNDYKSANGLWKDTYNLPTTSTSNTSYNGFSGNITATRWKTRAENNGTDYSGHFGYRYRYNYRNELDWAYFANITPYSNSTYEGRATYVSDYYNYITYDKSGNIKNMTRFGTNTFPCSGNSLYMDNLTYNYNTYPGLNRLTHIDDSYSNNCTPGELTDQGTNNFVYNQLGQIIRDVQGNQYTEYDVYGRVSKVRNGVNSWSPVKAEYFYGPDGKRVKKTVYDGSNWLTTWYAYDGSTLQSIYETSNACGGCGNLAQIEVPVYGSGRVGMVYPQSGWDYHYELADHLGNVRAVIREGSAGEMEVVNYTDYYAHGWALPGRQFSSSENYRYAYQGQFAEQDEETGWAAFDLRSYDGRVGRWMTRDPENEFYSPFLAMGNNPINFIDPTGGSTDSPIFDYDGNFLGVDSEGFKGDIIIMDRTAYMNLTNNNTTVLDHKQVMIWAESSPLAETLNHAMSTKFEYENPEHLDYVSKVFMNLLKAAADEGVITLSSDYFDRNRLEISAAHGRIASSGPGYVKGKWKITAYVNIFEKGEEPIYGGDFKHLWYLGNSGDAINILGVHEPLHQTYPGNEMHPIIDPIVLDPNQNPAIKLATPDYIKHVKNRMHK